MFVCVRGVIGKREEEKVNCSMPELCCVYKGGWGNLLEPMTCSRCASFMQLSSSFILYKLVFFHPPSSLSTSVISLRRSSMYSGLAASSHSKLVIMLDVVWMAANERANWASVMSYGSSLRCSSIHSMASEALCGFLPAISAALRSALRLATSGSMMRRPSLSRFRSFLRSAPK